MRRIWKSLGKGKLCKIYCIDFFQLKLIYRKSRFHQDSLYNYVLILFFDFFYWYGQNVTWNGTYYTPFLNALWLKIKRSLRSSHSTLFTKWMMYFRQFFYLKATFCYKFKKEELIIWLRMFLINWVVMAYTFNPSTWKEEAGRSLWVPDQPGLQS